MENKPNKLGMRDIVVGVLLLAFLTLMALLRESRNTPITSDRARLLLRNEAEAQQLSGDFTNLRLDDPQCQWQGYGHCTVEVEFNIDGVASAGICTYGPFEDDACTVTGKQAE
jgi:hypothetical protein